MSAGVKPLSIQWKWIGADVPGCHTDPELLPDPLDDELDDELALDAVAPLLLDALLVLDAPELLEVEPLAPTLPLVLVLPEVDDPEVDPLAVPPPEPCSGAPPDDPHPAHDVTSADTARAVTSVDETMRMARCYAARTPPPSPVYAWRCEREGDRRVLGVVVDGEVPVRGCV
jgi:hypothetical protein